MMSTSIIPPHLVEQNRNIRSEEGMGQLVLFGKPNQDGGLEDFLAGASHPQVIEREFWTARQRQAHSLHEVSYRACFKPQLPAYFIERLTQPGDIVYDPFSGRGTTALEAALHGRIPHANDINPLSTILCRPRIEPPHLQQVVERLAEMSVQADADFSDVDLSAFYHPDTESEIRNLRRYLMLRQASQEEDSIDRWIRMVATNRLTGHSPGFFSVYTLPPNQATTPERQVEINRRLGQKPEYRNVHALIIKKSRQLMGDISAAQRQVLARTAESAVFLNSRAQATPAIDDETVTLTVTSPPFLDVVQYAEDNWLRCWFNNIEVKPVAENMSVSRSIDQWATEMEAALGELYRITRKNGFVAYEVGEVRNGKVLLDEVISPLGEKVGFHWVATMINRQQFTKTSNIWGVRNNRAGTNSNRIVVFRKD
jgi:hypothetical protein